MPVGVWPQSGPEQDRWILSLRGARSPVDPRRAYARLIEYEPWSPGRWAQVFTIFLTNRECPWRCVMCDLWRHTLSSSTPLGAIPAQLDEALPHLTQAAQTTSPPLFPSITPIVNRRHLKLYNSGSFFDPRAIPLEDHPAILERVASFHRVVVECHPSLIGRDSRVVRFRDELQSAANVGAEPSTDRELEVAMGLETAHPEVLEALNKRMTLETYQKAARYLKSHQIRIRTFLLVHPPFMPEAEAEAWLRKSIDAAFEAGSDVVSLIPSRAGNGAMERLMANGQFREPSVQQLESAAEYGVTRNAGQVFADVWDLERFQSCSQCFESRRERLQRMNGEQRVAPPVSCSHCGDGRDVRKGEV